MRCSCWKHRTRLPSLTERTERRQDVRGGPGRARSLGSSARAGGAIPCAWSGVPVPFTVSESSRGEVTSSEERGKLGRAPRKCHPERFVQTNSLRVDAVARPARRAGQVGRSCQDASLTRRRRPRRRPARPLRRCPPAPHRTRLPRKEPRPRRAQASPNRRCDESRASHREAYARASSPERFRDAEGSAREVPGVPAEDQGPRGPPGDSGHDEAGAVLTPPARAPDLTPSARTASSPLPS